MAKKEAHPFLPCLKHIALAILATLLISFASSFISVAIYDEIFGDKLQLLQNCISDLVTMTIYALLLYAFHMRSRIYTYATHTEKLDVKQEILAFIRADGKYFFIIYAVFAFIRILAWVTPVAPLAVFTFLTIEMAMTTIFTHLHLPAVLASLLAGIYGCALVCLLALIRSRKIHRDDTTAKTR